MSRREKGDAGSMMFEDFFDTFINGRGSNGRQRSSENVSITEKEYQTLKAKAEKYEALVEDHKKVKTWNDQLMKELDDMKEDARKFKELEEEKEKFLRSLLQIRADFDNYKKRQERENSNYKQYVLEGLLKKLVSHYDDLIRALNLLKMLDGAEGIQKGFEIIVKNFEKVMDEEGVRRMDSEGQKFDPYKHEALMVEEERDDLPENTIIEVLDKGYFLNNKVLRPAKVKISKKSKLQNLNEKTEIIQDKKIKI
ncbi:MAG: nucleotide exchange factor GrpE [Candidatus Hodarchaeota archaeon]